MPADPAAQRTLLRLADLDAESRRVQHAAQTLPQHKSIASLMEARKRASDELVASDIEVDDLTVAIRKAEDDLVPVKERLARNERRIADGSVADSKVLSSLTDEVEHLKRRIGELEDAQLELMGSLEEATGHRDRIAAQKAEIETRLRDEVAARDEAVARLRAEAQDLQAARGPVTASVPGDLLKLYERLLASTGIGAALLRAGRCGGCQLQLTLADLDTFRKAPANEVVRCTECERILVRTAESGL